MPASNDSQHPTPEAANQLSEALADAVEIAASSIVAVHGRTRLPGTGTIWAVNDATYIVTASHVVEREENLTIGQADRDRIAVTLISRDLGTDLAVLRADTADLGSAITVRERPARVGNLALAIGRPYGAIAASFGAVTSIGSMRSRSYRTPMLIRTEATPMPGFSGGPLIDPTGSTYGITTSGLIRRPLLFGGDTGLLAIPFDHVADIVSDIITYGHVRYGWVGVSVQLVDLPDVVRESASDQDHGLLVCGVTPESPAALGGIAVGDILVHMAGQPLADVSDLKQVLTSRQIGHPVSTTVFRGDATFTIDMIPTERPEHKHTQPGGPHA